MQDQKLHKLYEEQLKPQLLSLENSRRIIQALYYLAFLDFIGIMVWIFSGKMPTVPGLFILLFSEAVILIFINNNHKIYHSTFKTEVVNKIVKLINPDYTFDHEKYITLQEFNQCRIFPTKAQYAVGDDFISGKIDKTVFKFSEIRAWSRTREIKRPNIVSILVRYLFSLRRLQFFDQYRKNGGLIFKGIMFYADFNKHLNEQTYVLPDVAERLFGKQGQAFQKSNYHGKLVKLENPLFERQFVVYGSSQQEARYVLTPVMMEAILAIKEKYNRKMYFSFAGANVYCAIRFKKGLFEPRIHSSGVRFADMEQMFDVFGLIETIIHEMNLNTRIWTKD